MNLDFEINYEVTDAQLLAFGISQRIITLSRQPFMRPNNGKTFEMPDFDIPYAMSIWDARETVSLAALAINNRGKSVCFPPCDKAWMGFVPNAEKMKCR